MPAATESVENGASTDVRESVGLPRTALRAARASALSGDRADALEALAANPLVGPHTDPGPLLDALLDANRSMLPAFSGT